MTHNLPLIGQARGKLPFSPQGWPFMITIAIATIAALKVPGECASESEDDQS